MPDAKITYAQSSDIKARSFREYRHDMKKKAIAELEFLPVLQDLLKPALVEKHGADKNLWFLTKGGVTQQPDYLATDSNGKTMQYEFQYAEKIKELDFVDFKVSKVGKKSKGVRYPHQDRQFFYVVKEGGRFAFIEPKWIMDEGKEAGVPAWGNRTAFRVPKSTFEGILKEGHGNLKAAITSTDNKNILLKAQTQYLLSDTNKFSCELQEAVDKDKLITIMPKTLEGFYRVCFLLERMDENPKQAGIWLIYLTSLFRKGISPDEIAMWMFAFDFLYFRCDTLQDNEIKTVNEILDKIREEIKSWQYQEGAFTRDPNISRMHETFAIIHVANLFEDIQQDFFVHYKSGRKVNRIFEILPDAAEIAAFIQNAAGTKS
ncbi:MAG: hypothetical protein OXF05_03220 [Hyphomicrobiales bacterium]|nr:hypothetical protein [Hyphomicrobiales bacterium]